MKQIVGAAAAAFFLAVTGSLAAPPIQLAPKAPNPAPSGAVSPDVLFSQGEFEQARAGYAAEPKSSPKYEEALRQMGAIALYQNHLGEAETMLTNARARDPADKRCLEFLAETLHRADRFAETASLLRQIGRPDRAAEFELFGKSEPYRVPPHQGVASVEMQWSEPFPVVKATVNGLAGLFLIDTGAPEVILDPQFAHDARIMLAGSSKTAGAGRMPAVLFGRIAKFGLTGVEVDDVPAMLVSTRGLTSSARNKRIAGIIGTQFLSHFRATIDYPRARLTLEPRDTPARTSGSIAQIPFWFLGDHVLLAQGRLDEAPRQLFFINTGISGYAFVAPDSTLRDAGIAVPALQAPPPGRIAQASTATFPISRLSLGELVENNVTGIYGSFPPALENGIGVHVGGIISHAFFHDYAVTFDFVQMQIGIRK